MKKLVPYPGHRGYKDTWGSSACGLLPLPHQSDVTAAKAVLHAAFCPEGEERCRSRGLHLGRPHVGLPWVTAFRTGYRLLGDLGWLLQLQSLTLGAVRVLNRYGAAFYLLGVHGRRLRPWTNGESSEQQSWGRLRPAIAT